MEIPNEQEIEQRAYKVAHVLVAKAVVLNKEWYDRKPELLSFRPDYSQCQIGLTNRLANVFTQLLGVSRSENMKENMKYRAWSKELSVSVLTGLPAGSTARITDQEK